MPDDDNKSPLPAPVSDAALMPFIPRGFSLSRDQQLLAVELVRLLNDDHQVLVVDGYAGTGKTTLVAAFVKYLQKQKRTVVLLASTGRAAKVLAEKARFPTETVHRHIYQLEVQEVDKILKTKRLVFELRSNMTPSDTVFVVDESSMIADHAPKEQFISYGSGRLMSDLIRYAGGRKIVFVGDSCQLPPVNVAYPPVFEPGYLNDKLGIATQRLRLTEQKRFPQDSGIFKLTDQWRRAIDEQQRLSLLINTDENEDIRLLFDQGEMARQLARRIKSYGIDQCIGVCYSNKTAYNHSQNVRQELFGHAGTIIPGEILIVIQNNYLFNISNGERIQIEKLGNSTRRAGLNFRQFTAQMTDFAGQRVLQGLLIEDILYSPLPGLSNEQEANLMVDFMIRMKKKGIKDGSEEFFKHQITDPYLNALRVKFGYVITCHKAQGGEWDDVFVDIENSLLKNPPDFYLRWSYTAVSRTAKTLWLLKKSFIR